MEFLQWKSTIFSNIFFFFSFVTHFASFDKVVPLRVDLFEKGRKYENYRVALPESAVIILCITRAIF